MTQTIVLTPSADPIGLEPVFRAGPLVLSGAAVTGITTYRAQVWRRPQDAREDGAEALATAYGISGSSGVSLALSGTSMDFTLTADGGNYDDVWFLISGVQSDGQIVPLRYGWVRVIETGCDPGNFVVGDVVVTVENGMAAFTIDGQLYKIPVWEETPASSGTTGWLVTVVDGMLILAKNGVSYAAPVIQQ